MAKFLGVDIRQGLPKKKGHIIEVVEHCEQGICPRCGGNLEVIGVVKVDGYVIETDYGAGYYAVRGSP